ncbi:MAG: phage protease [Deltaproteobacteria bacterium]|nr:phage protease [Deltaproteobacteria bacterium]
MKSRGRNIAINARSGQAPEWIHLLPSGKFTGRDGRGPWLLKDSGAFIRATMAHQAGADLPLDYEHQSLLAEENGRPAPAAGWIKELRARPDGIWGRVEWTPRGAAFVASREYRYISPVFIHDKAGVLERLESAALVAQPNLQLKALNKQGASTMEEFLRQLAALLGLAETASQEEIFAAVQQLKEGAPEANAADGDAEGAAGADGSPTADGEPENLAEAEADLRQAADNLVNQAEAAADPEINPAANRGAAGLVIAAHKAMHKLGSRLAAVEGEMARNKAAEAVGQAMTAGKITPALKAWALNYAAQDPAGFSAFIKTAPVIVRPGASKSAHGAAHGAGALSDEERAVCKQMGLAEADYIKARKEELNHGHAH